MPQEQPQQFDMKDLFIDVKLEACINGTSYDFLGKKLFSTSFFKESIGFGIVNIDIEVNTSLQPLVSITFKDLYGNTVFNTQDGESGLDNSVIFNWPPPKFLFSFKGFLGRPTTWVLNLKKTSTSFNANDSSYSLKCDFVPNQWGFFADIPFLYLLAAKRLRKDKIGDLSNLTELQKRDKLNSITSVFDLIKIGKQVEVKTQDTTKEFGDLVGQLGSIKSNMARSIAVSRIIDFGEEITGLVNNRQVQGFNVMKMPTLDDLGDPVNTQEKIEQRLGIPTQLNELNSYMLLSIKFDNKNGFDRFNISKNLNALRDNESAVISARNQVIEMITINLKKVDDEIKRVVFSTSESKLEKITIGEIFSQLARDSGFIMGSILDAGLDGYRGDEKRRKLRYDLSNILIGESFPLVIDKDGSEVPATKENIEGIGDSSINSSGVGVDEHEMDFVRRFINAISEGIARDLPTNGGSSGIPGQDDSLLKSRVNNLEMTQGNPYKSYYKNIATNILVRGGIVGFMTRSGDPNSPGSYGNYFFDNDGRQQIEEIAVRDASNISDSIIKNLSDVDSLLLKRFCDFMVRFYSADGEELLASDGSGDEIGDISNDVNTSIDHNVLMSTKPDTFLTFKTLWRELVTPNILDNAQVVDGAVQYGVVELESKLSSNYAFQEKEPVGNRNAQNPLSFVDPDTFTATRIINNGLAYCYPNPVDTRDSYWAVFFRGNDNKVAQEVNSAPSDAQFKSEDKDQDDPGQNEPLGYIPINSKFGDDNELLVRVKSLVKYRDDSAQTSEVSVVYDFEKIEDPDPSFYGAVSPLGNVGLNYFVWNNQIASDAFDADLITSNLSNLNETGVDVAGNIGWTVCAHSPVGSSTGLVFGLFTDTQEGISHRIFVRKVCETILQQIEQIEDERNQIIGSVLGKASEQEDAIYKQMHNLFHQWQTLSYSDGKTSSGSLCGNVDENRTGEGGESGKVYRVAEELEERFGGSHRNLMTYETLDVEGVNLSLINSRESSKIPDGTFIYDYPLQRIRGVGSNERAIQVKDAIINLEPLYNSDSNTTVLGMIQQICTKNNFLFIPIPGSPGYLDVSDIYSPSAEPASIEIRNFFHVLFTPTPESRAKTRNHNGDPISLSENHETYNTNSFLIKYGDPDNQIIKNIQVGTDDNKVTAESIINLQRLVDNENQNKKVTTDCSMLPVLSGRSYKATIDMIGNAQVYPMQFFFLKNSPLFGGLYQIMKVTHNISPNNMTTSAEGIRMRFSPGSGYGSVKPITLDTFRELGPAEAPLALGGSFDKADRDALKNAGSILDSVPTIIDEGDNIPVGGYTKDRIEAAVKSKGHIWFDKRGDYELNIVGIRNTSTGSAVTNKFDDFITVSYKSGGKWKFWSWKATTQPGKTWMLEPGRIEGTAILKPGQYIDSHIMRLHAGKYTALGQNGSMTVYRDNNLNLNYDLDPSTLMTSSGMGINIHRSNASTESWAVNNWSAGCQVFKRAVDFNTLMAIVRKAVNKQGNSFTYTLLNSSDIV